MSPMTTKYTIKAGKVEITASTWTKFITYMDTPQPTTLTKVGSGWLESDCRGLNRPGHPSQMTPL